MKHIFDRRFAQSSNNVTGNRTGQLFSLHIKFAINFMIRSSNLARKMSSNRNTANIVAENWGIDKAMVSATCIRCVTHFWNCISLLAPIPKDRGDSIHSITS